MFHLSLLKRVKCRALAILIFLTPIHFAWSQGEVFENLDFEKVIENILPQQEFDVDYNDLYDRLFSLYSNPLDLNTTERNEFQSLFFLNENQINGIINYRENYGEFLSIYELLTIDGFESDDIKQLAQFITIDQNKRMLFKNAIKQPATHNLFLRSKIILETKKGYALPDTLSSGRLTSRYAGNPNHLYARYTFANPGYYSFGFTIEKDPGEQLIWEPKTNRYGMDYYSFHVMIENRGVLKKVIIGDFSLDFGQGLVFGTGLNFGKGTEPVTTIRRNSLGLRPYRSVFENRDFSSLAMSTLIKGVDLNLFASCVKRDIKLREDTADFQEQFLSAIQTIGLHRTSSEILAKNQLGDRSIGGNISYRLMKGKLDVGINGIFTEYDIPYLPTQRKYNQFDFRGSENYVGSLYANYHLKNAHFFGEMATSKSGGKAISSGIVASLSSQVQASLHYRNHEKNFHSFYGASFGENTKIANEIGIYWGIKIVPLKKLIITSYVDFYKFPWLKYRVDKPSNGQDFMISGSYEFNANLIVRAYYRHKTKEENYAEDGDNHTQVIPKITNRMLINLKYKIDRNFSIQTRVQHSKININNSNNSGFLIAQDLNYQRGRYSLSARFSLFDTDNYNNR